MLRKTVIVGTLLLGGCGGGHPITDPPAQSLIPDWQQRTIMGETAIGGPSPGSIESEGALGVRLQGRGRTAIYDGGDAIAAPHPGVVYNAQGEVTLNFNDVDAKEAAKTVLEDILGQTHVIDPRVEGRVTIHSPKPVAPRAALRLLEAGLQQVGAVVIIRNGVHYVAPKGQAVAEAPNAIEPAGRGAVAGYSSRAVRLRHTTAAELAEILKPMAKEGSIRVDGARNLLILSGSATEHEAWMETVRTFDVDWLANRAVAVFKITSQQADGMVKSLNEVMRNENVDQQMVRFTTIDSTNSVLAVAKTPEALRTVRQWVKRLEATGAQQQQLFSYQMKYAQAKDVAPVLAKIFGTQSAGDQLGGGSTSAPTRGMGGSRTTMSAGSGFGSQGQQGSAQSASAAQPFGSMGGMNGQGMNGQGNTGQGMSNGQGNGQGIGMGGAGFTTGPVPGLTGARSQFLAGGQAGDGQVQSTMRIIPNEGTNTLLVYATDAEYDRVKNVLRSVDVPQRQVLVEATIIEVALTDDLRYGVQYYLNGRISGTPFEASLSNAGSKAISQTLPGFGMTLGSPAKVVIDALNDVTRVNIVSAPNVMVLNNQSARLQVGDQVPITTKSSQDPLQGNQVIVNNIEMRDTGVIFEVTPRINSSGSVLLDIVQEVSAVKDQSNASLTPTISQRKLSSSVTVDNGETIVLGGLFSTQGTLSRSGLPGLSAIPIVGAAFGTTKDDHVRTELVVLISPKIIDNRFDARAVTNEVRRRVQELRFEDPVVVPSHAVPSDAVERSALAYPGDCTAECGSTGITTSSITPWAAKATPTAPPERRLTRPTAPGPGSTRFKSLFD